MGRALWIALIRQDITVSCKAVKIFARASSTTSYGTVHPISFCWMQVSSSLPRCSFLSSSHLHDWHGFSPSSSARLGTQSRMCVAACWNEKRVFSDCLKGTDLKLSRSSPWPSMTFMLLNKSVPSDLPKRHHGTQWRACVCSLLCDTVGYIVRFAS